MSNEFRKPTALLKGVTGILGMDDGDAGLVRLAEELTVGCDPWKLPEWAAMVGHTLIWKTAFKAAGGAGFRTIMQLFNESTDSIVILEPGSRWIVAAPATSVQIARPFAAATTDDSLAAFGRDTRRPTSAIPGVRFRSQNGVALPATFSNFTVFQSATLVYDLLYPIVIGPATSVAVFPDIDNATLVANWVARVVRIQTLAELAPNA